jgi:hypothetical protein
VPRAKPSDATEWILSKLAKMRARMDVPLPEPPTPRARVAASKAPKRDIVHETPRPDGVPLAEWEAALRNVMSGSAPSTIAFGSDIPSDESVRREHAYGATMGRRERQR